MGVGHTQDSGFCVNGENGANLSGDGFEPECRIGLGGNRKRCDDALASSITLPILSHSPEPCRESNPEHRPTLKKGDRVTFTGKEKRSRRRENV